MNRLGVTRLAPYIVVGIALWVFVLKSGVHATLAGVALGLAIPLEDRSGRKILEALEDALHPYVIWGILPLFAFANAGVSLAGITVSSFMAPLPLAIAAGLVIGKPLGIMAAALGAVRSGLARLPEGMSWMHLLGVSALAGIGFTMSLFIGMLAFEADEHSAGVRIGVIAGSLIAALVGYLVLRFSPTTAVLSLIHPGGCAMRPTSSRPPGSRCAARPSPRPPAGRAPGIGRSPAPACGGWRWRTGPGRSPAR